MNRFTDQWKKHDQMHLSVGDWIGGDLSFLILDCNWCLLNDIELESSDQIIEIMNSFFCCGLNVNDFWQIEFKYLSVFEKLPRNRQGFLLVYDNCVFGCVLLEWDHNIEPSTAHNIQYKTCEIVGGGQFFRPILLELIKFDVSKFNTFIPELDKQTIGACIQDVYFDPKFNHKLGYTLTRIDTKYCGDWKGLFEYMGHKGAAATHRCVWCLSSKKDQFESPTPQNRCWSSRTSYSNVQGAISAVTNSNDHLQASLKRFPLMQCGFDKILIPTLHTNLGPIHNIFVAIVNKIAEANGSKNQMNAYNEKYHKMVELKTTLINLRESLKFIQNQENFDIFDCEFGESIEKQQESLEKQITKVKSELTVAKHDFNTLSQQMKEQDCHAKMLDLHTRMGINPWDVKKSSMIGAAGKKFLQNHDILLDELKSIDNECYELCKPMVMRLKYWCDVTWSKHLTLFSDECLKVLKWNMHEFTKLYFDFIRKYGGGKGSRFGIKIHGFYHIFEFCEAKRFSPAECDDQRVEAWNAYIAQYEPLFSCFGGKINLDKMMNKIWREFVLNWDCGNNNIVWNGHKLI